MAVQKKRSTRSKKGMRRSHNCLKNMQLSFNSISNEIHFRHHMTLKGYYRGNKYINK